MPKKKIEIELYTYGEYEKWDKNSKTLPKIKNITNAIEAEEGTEFGYTLKIRKAKGKKLFYRIIHPPFLNEQGQPAPDFTGEVIINSNDYSFFLGDYIWTPIENKLGAWRLITHLDQEKIADKTLHLIKKEDVKSK